MAAENAQQAVFAKELLDWLFTKIIGTVAFRVLFKVSMHSFLVLHRVGPHQVAEDAIKWNLLFAVDLVNLLDEFEAG